MMDYNDLIKLVLELEQKVVELERYQVDLRNAVMAVKQERSCKPEHFWP